jgi:transcriptional regulator with XRE-family HTH domain
MRKTLRSPDHSRLLDLLIASRKAAGLTQHALARRLKKHQSFVAKYENGERRLDIVEFVVLARALGEDPERLFRRYLKGGN